ncbi:MAG: response regulator, partial [Mesorhizobium sp.]
MESPIKPQILISLVELDIASIMRAKRAGAQGYLLKPFNRPQLLERFRALKIAA